MKLAARISISIAVFASAALIATAQPYGSPDTANAGVVWGNDAHAIGLELRGAPGLFECQYDNCHAWPLAVYEDGSGTFASVVFCLPGAICNE